jgi:hypothetical protein
MTPPANAMMLAVWKDIKGYLDFADVSRVAGVSRRFRSVAVLGGGPRRCMIRRCRDFDRTIDSDEEKKAKNTHAYMHGARAFRPRPNRIIEAARAGGAGAGVVNVESSRVIPCRTEQQLPVPVRYGTYFLNANTPRHTCVCRVVLYHRYGWK